MAAAVAAAVASSPLFYTPSPTHNKFAKPKYPPPPEDTNRQSHSDTTPDVFPPVNGCQVLPFLPLLKTVQLLIAATLTNTLTKEAVWQQQQHNACTGGSDKSTDHACTAG